MILNIFYIINYYLYNKISKGFHTIPPRDVCSFFYNQSINVYVINNMIDDINYSNNNEERLEIGFVAHQRQLKIKFIN